MFRFAHPAYLYLLLLIPLLVALYIYSNIRRKRALAQFGNLVIIEQLMPDASKARDRLKFYLTLIALLFLILVVSGPQLGSKIDKVKRSGIELMVALDVSNSMMANDVSPNRLGRSKQVLSKLVDSSVDDRLGLIVFAGSPYIQLPMTSDYVSAKMFLNSIETGMVPTQGTAIGAAIDMAISSFPPEQEGNEKSRAIIIITDGENHEDDAKQAAANAAQRGIKVHVVGVGTPAGSPIPVGSSSFLRDSQGSVVVTKLNEAMCKEIASAGSGIYVRMDNTNGALRALTNELDKMAKTDIEGVVFSDYDEKFYYVAWLALLLLVVELFIWGRKNSLSKRYKIF